MAVFFHQALAWAGKEIVSTELPGELWVSVFDTPERPTYCEGAVESASAPVISIQKFLGALLERPQDAALQTLLPWVQEARELGYDYVMLTN